VFFRHVAGSQKAAHTFWDRNYIKNHRQTNGRSKWKRMTTSRASIVVTQITAATNYGSGASAHIGQGGRRQHYDVCYLIVLSKPALLYCPSRMQCSGKPFSYWIRKCLDITYWPRCRNPIVLISPSSRATARANNLKAYKH
jgi:hypothetical protein